MFYKNKSIGQVLLLGQTTGCQNTYSQITVGQKTAGQKTGDQIQVTPSILVN